MARLMSVALTAGQVRARAKTVTRRDGWEFLRPGDQVTLCPKVRGRKDGEPLERIVTVTVTSVRRERLDAVTPGDVAAEGFPDMSPEQFVAFFCGSHRDVAPDSTVTRIEWEYPADPARLREAREYLGLPAGVAASILGWPRQAVEALEDGSAVPVPGTLERLGRFYLRPAAWLRGQVERRPFIGAVCALGDLTDGDREEINSFVEFLRGLDHLPPRPGRDSTGADPGDCNETEQEEN